VYLRESGVVRPRSREGQSPLSLQACRTLNVLVAVIALVVLAPLMLIIAVAVKLSSSGPVFYKQPRVGIYRRGLRGKDDDSRRIQDYGGRVFTMYKFRSMVQAKSDSPQVWAQSGDARITRVGQVIRRYRLDELPQFWNVLAGDMNIVGPRPEQPEIFLRLCVEVPHLSSRQQVLPGITGLAQVNQHYDRSIDDVRRKADLDWEYIRRRSPLLDLEIMAKTVPTVVLKRGSI
jgi:lipopolysaccharide/colanic/teichoic acid biosynthesis glycosyltransferase